MTLNQLQSLDDSELALVLYVVNHISPPVTPPPPFEPIHLTWWKHQALVQKLIDAFPQIKPEAHAIYSSLMEKLGVKVEIKPVPPPEAPPTQSIFTPNPEPVQTPDMPEMFNQMPTESI